jgi:hypothetical protein
MLIAKATGTPIMSMVAMRTAIARSTRDHRRQSRTMSRIDRRPRAIRAG